MRRISLFEVTALLPSVTGDPVTDKVLDLSTKKGIQQGFSEGAKQLVNKLPIEEMAQGARQLLPEAMQGVVPEGAASGAAAAAEAGTAAGLGEFIGPIGWASFGDAISDTVGLTNDTKGENPPLPQMGFESNPIDTYQNSALKWGLDNAVQPATEWATDKAVDLGKGTFDAGKSLWNTVTGSTNPAVDRASIPNEHLGW